MEERGPRFSVVEEGKSKSNLHIRKQIEIQAEFYSYFILHKRLVLFSEEKRSTLRIIVISSSRKLMQIVWVESQVLCLFLDICTVFYFCTYNSEIFSLIEVFIAH